MNEMATNNKHRMLIISTGGTIAGEVATDKKAADYEIKKAEHFANLIKGVISYHAKKYSIQIIPEPNELIEVDSSDIMPKHWKLISDLIYERFDEFDSFVVTHGTNTLGYTCSALTFALPNIGKPVILTGSQVPIEMPGSDAQLNLENAVRLAANPPTAKHKIRGVMAVFGSHIISGTRVKKATEFDYDAFKSFSSGSIGRIGRIIDIDQNNINKHTGYLTHMDWHMATSKKDLRLENEFDENVVSLTEFPGMRPEILTDLANQGAKGIVIRAFGAGDLSTVFQGEYGEDGTLIKEGVLYELKKRSIPVVATTQAPDGRATMSVNVPGQQLRNAKLAIPANDMSIESQTVKLMWLLAQMQKGSINYEMLCRQMVTDLHGEISKLEDEE